MVLIKKNKKNNVKSFNKIKNIQFKNKLFSLIKLNNKNVYSQTYLKEFYFKYFYKNINGKVFLKNKKVNGVILRKILLKLHKVILKRIKIVFILKYKTFGKFFYYNKSVLYFRKYFYKILNRFILNITENKKKTKIVFTKKPSKLFNKLKRRMEDNFLLYLKRRKRKKQRYFRGLVFKKRYLKITNQVYYNKYKDILLLNKVKKYRSKLFLYKWKVRQNKVLRNYFLMLYLFNNHDLSENFKKRLNYIKFFKKKFNIKRNKTFFKLLNLTKNENRSFINVYYKLNNRIISFLFNLGYKNPSLPLKLNKIYINGHLVNYSNFQLCAGDLVYLNSNKINLPVSMVLNSKNKILNKLSFNQKNNVIMFDNFFYLKSLKFKKDLINLKSYRYISNPLFFYLKIFKKNLYFSRNNFKKFKELKLRKNKYFKLKYLFKKKKLSYRTYKKILNMFKFAKRYKKNNTSKKKFYRKIKLVRLFQRNKTTLSSIESIYRYLHSLK